MICILHDDILAAEILPKLPPKSLLRFKCVGRSWQALISSPEFTNLHLRQSLSSKSNWLAVFLSRKNVMPMDIFQRDDSLVSVELDLLQTHTAEMPPHQDFSFLMGDWFNFMMTAISCNGLLCFQTGTDIVVLNPSTKTFRKISLENHDIVHAGFGYDRDSDDYKIVKLRIVSSDTKYREVAVFSLRGPNCWRQVEYAACQDRPIITTEGALIDNHLVHWPFESNTEEGRRHRIGCFDICSERWIDDVPLPDGESPTLMFDLRVVDGCLCMMTPYWGFPYHMWVMKEYGVKESWVKLWDDAVLDKCYPIIAHQKISDFTILVQCPFTELLYWYNTRDGSFEPFKPLSITHNRRINVCLCVGSLVSIPGGDRIHQAAN